MRFFLLHFVLEDHVAAVLGQADVQNVYALLWGVNKVGELFLAELAEEVSPGVNSRVRALALRPLVGQPFAQAA